MDDFVWSQGEFPSYAGDKVCYQSRVSGIEFQQKHSQIEVTQKAPVNHQYSMQAL